MTFNRVSLVKELQANHKPLPKANPPRPNRKYADHGYAVLIRGPLTLDTAPRTLRGPAGTTPLTWALTRLLVNLMRSVSLSTDDLLRLVYVPAGGFTPNHHRALRTQIMRIRVALEAVGVPAATLKNWHGLGYGLDLPLVAETRTFTGPQLAQLDALLASHPDRDAVSQLGW